jgi:succinyl-diaminopimelate desuccinylase
MERLYRRIDDKRDDAVALTQAMVRIPTVNPPGDAYQACAELLGTRLAARGFDVSYLRAEGSPGDSDRYPRVNMVARREGRMPGPCLHFNGHIDVVEPGHGWHFDPFAAEIRDGKIFGRGTCDMKGGLAAAIVAVEALLEAHPDLPGALEISATADEESGGFGGVAYLAEQGFFSKPRVDHVVIPEPLNVDRVCLGHRGVWWAEVETKGKIAHGSMPFLGDSAIRHMNAFLSRCEKDLYPKLAEKTSSMPVVPDAARHSTLNFNALHGGLGEGHDGLPAALVADSCRLVLDRRFLLGETLEEVKQEVISILDGLRDSRPGFCYEIHDIMTVLPQMTDADAPVVRAVSAAVTEVLGRAPEQVVSPGTYDQKHITRIGHLKDCIAYGPGILDLAHQPDEFIVIDDMVQSAKVMARASLALLQGEAGGAE